MINSYSITSIRLTEKDDTTACFKFNAESFWHDNIEFPHSPHINYTITSISISYNYTVYR